MNDTLETLIGGNASTLSFSVLNISNAGNYTCVVTINSRYLTEAIRATTNIFKVKFQGTNNFLHECKTIII